VGTDWIICAEARATKRITDGTMELSRSKVLAGRHHTGTGRTPEWMRQASQGVWHRASSSEPGQASDTGDARLALNGNPWGLRSGRLEGLEVENLRELGRGDVALRPLDCKRQHWPLASDNGISCSAYASADLRASNEACGHDN